MKYFVTILFCLILFNRISQMGFPEPFDNLEKYLYENYLDKKRFLNPNFRPDLSIGHISLLNSENIDLYLGEDIMDRLVDEDLPNSSVISNDSKQRLTIYFHPGNISKEFSEFQINYVNRIGEGEKITSDVEFKTESGIKLGMTIEKLRLIKGEPNSKISDVNTVLHYKINDFENSEFLQKYNMPFYYADYVFERELLIEFKFGFEYP